jgi:hypothetical protein
MYIKSTKTRVIQSAFITGQVIAEFARHWEETETYSLKQDFILQQEELNRNIAIINENGDNTKGIAFGTDWEAFCRSEFIFSAHQANRYQELYRFIAAFPAFLFICSPLKYFYDKLGRALHGYLNVHKEYYNELVMKLNDILNVCAL